MKRTLVIGGIVASMIFGVVAYAMAATTIGSGSPLSTNQTVTVGATVNPRLELTLDTNTVAFGPVEPGILTGGHSVAIGVKSNKGYTVTKAIADPLNSAGDKSMGLATSWANAAVPDVKGEHNYTDNYSVLVPFTTDANAVLSATVQYTVTQ